MSAHDRQDELTRIAQRAMREHGLEPDFPAAALEQLRTISGPPAAAATLRDLRALLWCSIDNDDSRDLDQLSVAESLPGGATRVLVAVADVDATVPAGSPLDVHASGNTTSVYTAAEIFPMLPERLSTDLTSLAAGAERPSFVIEMTVTADGAVSASDVYQARVLNRAKLAYNSVAAWLDGRGPIPAPVAAVRGMDEQLRMQHRVAQALKAVRKAQGALGLTTLEAQAVYEGSKLIDLRPDEDNRAKELIEYFMIAANEVVARFLEARRSSSLRRVLRVPERWGRIVQLAASSGTTLPAAADPKALSDFLLHSQQTNPQTFPDLSLAVVKLLGAGEYVLKRPGEPAEGHFGLALSDYTHATAPNRRFPDLISQRLIRAALTGKGAPYDDATLRTLAQHCTQQEGNAAKVERQVRKSAAAMLLEAHIGEQFDALVTGVNDAGTWVRIAQPLAEGRLVHGFERLDVGDAVRVRLTHTDIERGFIDFARVT
ncbi:MAG TPA: RNB domain-containing ribonuclease [Steroidobacteraceae bacterium]|jgi:VacB/RNase II family 3'-5' exoribonuclease|nr:RNB domain-containing ribonuclease [Steroidobacteraceae bacterium]